MRVPTQGARAATVGPGDDVSCDPRIRLQLAALELFARDGYDATTVDDIAAKAGISRRTFFRYFRSKEEAVFPDHESLLHQVEEELEGGSDAVAPVRTACRALSVVFESYLAEPDVSLRRYRLISSIPALRDRENASIARYQRLLTVHLRKRFGDTPEDTLQAEMAAASAIAAHNAVLRTWLHAGCSGTPQADLERAFAQVSASFEPEGMSDARAPTARRVVLMAIETDVPLTAIRDRMRGLEE